MILEGHEIKRDLREEVDVVIIGSGCGGATAAKHMTQSGPSVLLLEEGGH